MEFRAIIAPRMRFVKKNVCDSRAGKKKIRSGRAPGKRNPHGPKLVGER
jgi:hypothetical protein